MKPQQRQRLELEHLHAMRFRIRDIEKSLVRRDVRRAPEPPRLLPGTLGRVRAQTIGPHLGQRGEPLPHGVVAKDAPAIG
jgi:hypothetical protein